MKNTAILVTTFLRDGCLFRCVESIRQFYPDIPIYIGDNGHCTEEKKWFAKDNNCEYLELPFDCGVGGTRNEAIDRLPKNIEYLVIVEDDCVFTEGTRLENWYQILQKDTEIGIIGGLLKKADGEEQHYEGYHQIEGRIKYADKAINPEWHKIGDIKFFYCDLVLNVFMMRLAIWRGGSSICQNAIQWDPQFKTALEHADFFMNVKYRWTKKGTTRRNNAWKIAYTPDVWMYHLHEEPNIEYKRYRGRTVGFRLFAEKWGFDYSYSDYNKENPIIYNPKVREKPKYFIRDLLLNKATEILNKYKIKWWLMSGSCLGAIREKGYIEHDTDIDIGIAPNQEWFWDILMAEMGRQSIPLYKDWYHNNQKIELTFQKYGTKIDFFFYKRKGRRLWYGAFGPDKAGRWGDFMKFIPRSFPAYLFKNPRSIELRGVQCHVPSPPTKFLELMYGKDWRRPKKNWRYWEDCKALDKSLMTDHIDVLICDSWDKIDKKDLELLRASKKLGNRLTIGVFTDIALKKAGIPHESSQEIRINNLKKYKSIDRIVKIESMAFARDLQKVGFLPDYFVAFSGEDGRSIEYLETFGCKIIPIEDVIKMTYVIKWKKSRKNIIAIGIKTFLREDNFFKTIEAIKQNFPYPYRLYIADDGTRSHEKDSLYEKLESEGHKIFRLPYNIGISAGRNAIIRNVEEDYVLIMDDDIKINDPETIVKMKKVLDSDTNIGIVSGVLLHELSNKTFGNDNYSGGIDFRIDRGILHRTTTINSIEDIDGIAYRQSDQVINFFLAKKEVFDLMKWDSQIKVEYEHMDFFLEFQKTPWKAVICLDAKAVHQHPLPHDMEYDYYRRSAVSEYFFKKHGIKNVINHWAEGRNHAR